MQVIFPGAPNSNRPIMCNRMVSSKPETLKAVERKRDSTKLHPESYVQVDDLGAPPSKMQIRISRKLNDIARPSVNKSGPRQATCED